MTTETIKAGQWIITEGGAPSYYLYKMLNGKVSIYESGKKINSIEIKEGMKPKILGILAVLRDDRINTASIKAETDVEVETLYMDDFKRLLRHDVPENMRKDIDAIIETIALVSKIRSLRREFSKTLPVKLQIPDDINPEISEVLSELKELYEVITSKESI